MYDSVELVVQGMDGVVVVVTCAVDVVVDEAKVVVATVVVSEVVISAVVVTVVVISVVEVEAVVTVVV